MTSEDERFRKPSDSQELPQASEPVPGNAGIVSRMPLGDPGYPWASYPWMPLDDALGRADSYAEAGDFTGEQEATIVLAAEVRRLRDFEHNYGVVEESHRNVSQMYITEARKTKQLEAKLARVEALLPRWRDVTAYNMGGDEAADELEAALRDET